MSDRGEVASAAANTISVAVAAKLLMVSQRRVQQLAQQSWIPKPYTVVGVVQGYIKFLQDEQRSASKAAADEVLRHERARKLRLANDQAEHLLVRTEEAIAAIDAIVGPIKSDLAGVPARVTDDLALRRAIEDQTDEILADLARRFAKAGADLRAGRDPLEAGAADDADHVGEVEPEISAVGGPAGEA